MKQRIGLYGGAFDPIHFGHLILLQTALEQLEMDKIILMPSGGISHYKTESPFASGKDRLEMGRLACLSNPKFEVSSYEVDQGKFVYTIDTLHYLQHQVSEEANIILLVGGDWKDKIPTWKEGDRLLREFTVAVFSRPGFEHQTDLNPKTEDNFLYVDMPLIEISSSMIRERVRNNLSIEYFLPSAVKWYIEEHKLYSDSSSLFHNK